MEVNNEMIDYNNGNHRLYFPNKIIVNWFIDSMDLSKECFPYYSEFEWKFNNYHSFAKEEL